MRASAIVVLSRSEESLVRGGKQRLRCRLLFERVMIKTEEYAG